MKADRNYKMSKQGKITLARLWNNPALPEIRKGLIISEIAGKQVVRGKREGVK